MDVLCKVGGLDIAAMTGFYLGCAFRKLPVLLDGAISCAAALCAVRLCPQAEKSLLASHRPAEPCGRLLLEALGLEPEAVRTAPLPDALAEGAWDQTALELAWEWGLLPEDAGSAAEIARVQGGAMADAFAALL